MGWTSSSDMKQQLRLQFETKEEAIAYCERHGIAYQVFETHAGASARASRIRTISPTAAARLDALIRRDRGEACARLEAISF